MISLGSMAVLWLITLKIVQTIPDASLIMKLSVSLSILTFIWNSNFSCGKKIWYGSLPAGGKVEWDTVVMRRMGNVIADFKPHEWNHKNVLVQILHLAFMFQHCIVILWFAVFCLASFSCVHSNVVLSPRSLRLWACTSHSCLRSTSVILQFKANLLLCSI